jgi:FMN phosphatase YigB (HAD superfamily)
MNDARAIDAVFLDLDATLLDENYVVTASVAACRQIAREHPELDAETLANANYETWMRYWPEIEPDWILGTLTTDELRTETWRRTLARLGSEDNAIVARVAAVHRGFELAEYRPFEDVLPTLDTLRRSGLRLVVVTNGASDTQREKLDIMDITRRVEPRGCGVARRRAPTRPRHPVPGRAADPPRLFASITQAELPLRAAEPRTCAGARSRPEDSA